MSDSPSPQGPRGLAPLLGRAWPWAILAAGLIAVTVFVSTRAPPPPTLPVLGEVPPFTLKDQTDQPFSSGKLLGKTWVADFIFTRCPDACPLMTKKMAKLEAHTASLGDALHFVSFSVDPKYDTPDRLMAYAEAHHADPRRWRFLTGPLGAIRRTVVDGFKETMNPPASDAGDANGNPSFFQIVHGIHFILVDGQGRIRGYYNSSDAKAMAKLAKDAVRLAGHS